MRLLVHIQTPDGDEISFEMECSEPLTLDEIRWLVYGRIVDRNCKEPIGCDPNNCRVQIDRMKDSIEMGESPYYTVSII